MSTYKVLFKDSVSPVGVVTENNLVVKVHPDVGKVMGMHIDKVKKLVKKRKGTIIKVKGLIHGTDTKS
jgi:hypothetical protein